MKYMKRFFCLLTLVLLSLSLLAGCGSPDSESQDAEVIYDFGDTVERNGEQIDVCVCHDQKAVYFYYDDEEHKLLDKAALPTQELHDKNWEIEFVDTTDFTGDGNSDLRITLEHEDESESYIVWEWEEDKGYVYRPDDSWFYMALMLSDVDISFVHAKLAGRWYCQSVDPYEFIEFDVNGNWELCFDEDNVADSGHLRYEPKEGVFFLCSDKDGAMDGSYLETYGAEIYISAGYSFDIDRLSRYVGHWMCAFTDECDYLDIDRDGNWQLWFEGNVIDEGYLWCDEAQGVVWSYSKRKSDSESTSIGELETDGGFWFCDYGYFRRAEDMEKVLAWIESNKDSEEYQQDVSMFTGTWYLDNDLSAETYLVIDSEGNWSCYQRAPGDAEGTEMYSATFSGCGYEFSGTEYEVYYEDFTTSDGVLYQMLGLDEGILAWGVDTYYRIDD